MCCAGSLPIRPCRQDLVDRLIAVADDDIAVGLVAREDLSHAQAVALAARVPASGVQLAYAGLLAAADVDPVTQPRTLPSPCSTSEPVPGMGAPLRSRSGPGAPGGTGRLPRPPGECDETLTADPDVRVVAEVALSTTPTWPPGSPAIRTPRSAVRWLPTRQRPGRTGSAHRARGCLRRVDAWSVPVKRAVHARAAVPAARLRAASGRFLRRVPRVRNASSAGDQPRAGPPRQSGQIAHRGEHDR
ncbi:hypothetical protein SHIRM173S_07515 [Streptomyces hirsutus]